MIKDKLEKRISDINEAIVKAQQALQLSSQHLQMLEGAKMECLNWLKIHEEEKVDEKECKEEKC